MIRTAVSLLVLAAAAAVPPSLLRNDAPALEVRTSIRPVAQDEIQLLRRVKPGMYRCSVVVADEPGSHRVFATKDLVLAAGESGQESATYGPIRLQFRASLGKKLETAVTTVTVYRDEKIVTRQSSTVALARGESQ
jgi:hypothetical protein